MDIDKALAPISKEIAYLLGEKRGRTISQVFEDNTGISKDLFHLGLLFGGVYLIDRLTSKN